MRSIRLLATLATLACGFTAHADLLYSIDTDTDELVAIDPATGAVAVIGPLGHDVGDIDLTMLDGQLYGLNSIYQERVELLAIDRDTGSATAPVEVLRGGASIINAEGLTSICGELVIGLHDPATGAHPAFSNALATLTPEGTVQDVVPFGSTDDFDALSADTTGFDLRSIDAQGTDLPALYYIGKRTPPDLTTVSTFTLDEAVNDILLHGASVHMISHTSPILYRVDAVTGALLEAVALDRPGRYNGLAAEDPGTCAGDIDRGASVGFQDLTQLLGNWGPCDACPCPWDLDGDGSVGFNDLTTQLGNWGTCSNG